MRTVTISGKKFRDDTQHTKYPSNVLPLVRIPSDRIPEVVPYSTDVQTLPFSSIDRELTKVIRGSRHLPQILDYSRLTVDKMPSYDEQVALMLPLGHDYSSDMLTYKDPTYQKWVLWLVERIMKNHSGQDVEECCRVLCTDYGVCVPYANTLRCDGSMSLEKYWDKERVRTFGDSFQRVLLRQFDTVQVEESIPPKNVTKSCGLNNRWPDGKLIDRKDFLYNSNLVTSNLFDNTSRYNMGPFKDAWLRSGRVLENLQYFLKHCHEFTEPEVLLHAVEHFGCSISSEAYRTNNADPTKADFPFSMDTCFYKKDRLWAFEDDDFTFKQGLIDDKKYSMMFRKRNPGHIFTLLKKRPMWPNLNASFTPPFIYLFRKITKNLEHGASGFPNSSTEFLESCKVFIDESAEFEIKWLNFDRTNSERVIGDNLQLVKLIFGEKIGSIMEALGVAIVPSRFGPRVSVNCFPSGGPQTTAGNFGCGGFEMSNLLFEILNKISQLIFKEMYSITKITFKGIADDWCESIEKNIHYKSYFQDNLRIKYQAGTDDQIAGIAVKKRFAKQVFKLIEDLLEEYFPPRFLGGGLFDEVTCFGINFKKNLVEPSKSLGLGKFPLIEKERNGDFIALKMYMRLCALPEFYDDIAASFREFSFGDISNYKIGAKSAFEILALQGFPTEEFFNIHSPVENLIYSNAMQNPSFQQITQQSDNLMKSKNSSINRGSALYDPRLDTTYDVSYFNEFDQVLREFLV